MVTDDQRYDTMGEFMPETQARVFDEGVAFSNAFVTTPLCCPSRASILTGMYAHDHGVLNHEEPLTHATMVHRLHDSGYFTGLVGKYLNSWDGSPRPEFDFWAGLLPLSTDPYFNADINVNGTWTRPPYYVTRVFEAHALDFLGEAAERETSRSFCSLLQMRRTAQQSQRPVMRNCTRTYRHTGPPTTTKQTFPTNRSGCAAGLP